MDAGIISSPTSYLKHRLGPLPAERQLGDLEAWWQRSGKVSSATIDRQGTPWLRMFDRFGARVDEILYPPEYWEMLRTGYRAGAVWRAFAEESLLGPYQIGYVTSFFDPGLYCPYIVSLATAVPLFKYAESSVREQFLPFLLRRDDSVWQGATWMTEAGGGSDLGANVETVARRSEGKWLLTGEKYFASNAGADLAVVAARPEGGASGVRGLALFLLPRRKVDGSLNYLIRRLKDKTGTRSVPTGEVELHASEAYLLGDAAKGIYSILEVLNLSRVANSIGSVGLSQRALSEAWTFAEKRIAFGKPIIDQPLLRRQFDARMETLKAAFCLAWECVTLLNQVWRETPPYSERYHLFRLVAHLSKYWTAEVAVDMAEWAMKVHGGMGVLAEYPVERLLREAMVLPIWEGTPHRQILDGLEVMMRKKAHRLLLDYLVERGGEPETLTPLQAVAETWLALEPEAREAEGESYFRALAEQTARTLTLLPR
ncbi:MAG: acyl-CoA dehydrogenase family protein [Chloroflexi bacterium]|nr:acyl-CoA dehydrogenase family protein [Chloroflexota bacterium]